jgi:hypothetical protein
MDEPLLWSSDRVGNGKEILTYFARFCVATNCDKLSDSGSLMLQPAALHFPFKGT